MAEGAQAWVESDGSLVCETDLEVCNAVRQKLVILAWDLPLVRRLSGV